MKALILLLLLAILQASSAYDLEKTAWKNESSCKIIAVEGDKILIIANQYGGEDCAMKLTTDGGSSWRDLEVNSIETSSLNGSLSGSSIILHWSDPEWRLAVSTDLGKTWNYKPEGLPEGQQAVRAIFNGETPYLSLFGENGGLFTSTDGGASWTNISPKIEQAKFGEFSVISNNIYLATDQGIYLSQDNGANWEELANFPTQITTLKAIDHNMFSLSGELGTSTLWRSSDEGRTWVDCRDKLPNDFTPKMITIIGDKVFLASQNDTYSGIYAELYMSADKGKSWTAKNAVPFVNSSAGSLLASKNSLIAYAYDSLFISTDYGETWISEIKGFPWGGCVMSEPKITPSHLSVSIGNQIYVSKDNGFNWNKAYGEINYSQVFGFASLGDTLFVVCRPSPGYTSYQDALYFSTDKGDTWNRAGMTGEKLTGLMNSEGRLIANTSSSLMVSSDRGETWKYPGNIWPNNSRVEYLLFKQNKIITGSKLYGFLYSESNGESWETRNNGFPTPYFEVEGFWPVDGNLYASVNNNLFYSSDDGANWSLRDKGIEDNIDNRIRIDGKGSDAYLAKGQNLYFTGDNGANWNKLTSLDSLSDSHSISSFKVLDGAVIVSIASKGIFISLDKGNTWKKINKKVTGNIADLWGNIIQVGEYVYFSNEIFGEKYYLYAIYRAKLSDLKSTPEEAVNVTKILIAPNPAQDRINLRGVNDYAKRFVILNTLGREMLSGFYDGGEINISNLPAGKYFLKIGADVNAFVKM